MRVLDVLVVLVAAATIIATRAAWDAQATDRMPLTSSHAAEPRCVDTHGSWRDQGGTERPWTASLHLRSNGAVLACTPRGGTMRLELVGSPALGRHAHAVVVVGGGTVFDGEVATRASLALDVVEGTPVLIAFVNDLYRSPEEDRDLWVGPVTFTTP